jgi:hypothetical protein
VSPDIPAVSAPAALERQGIDDMHDTIAGNQVALDDLGIAEAETSAAADFDITTTQGLDLLLLQQIGGPEKAADDMI